jgi:predicted nucleotidyltransferase
MNIQSDFEKFLKLLEKNNVRYMIIGGYAVAFHGYPRFTKDMDIFFLNDNENVKKIVYTLIQFGFNKKGNIIQC